MDTSKWHLDTFRLLRKQITTARQMDMKEEILLLEDMVSKLDALFDSRVSNSMVKVAPISLNRFTKPVRKLPVSGASVKPAKKAGSYTGIRTADLPEVMTEDEFQGYLAIKREEKPGDKFFANEAAIRTWLQSKGKSISSE